MGLERIIRPFQTEGMSFPFAPAGFATTPTENARLEVGNSEGGTTTASESWNYSISYYMDATERELMVDYFRTV